MPPVVASRTSISADDAGDSRRSLGLRHRLRSATAGAHARLDTRLSALDLQSLPGYRRFLEVNAAALLPLEAALANAGVKRIFTDWQQRVRRKAILADIAKVGGDVPTLSEPEPLDFGGVLGTMYVLEGSRLGAKVLLSRAVQSNDPTIAEATAFLRHGTGQHLWQSFLTALEHHAATLSSDASAISGARRAFDLFADAAFLVSRSRTGLALA